MTQSSLPHVEWIDLHLDGIDQEVIVMSKNQNNGDIFFIAIQDLDQIDRARMLQVLRRKDAGKYPLWDLLSQTTLRNGMNALEFFHQLVKIRTVTGKILPVGAGKQGSMNFTANPNLTAKPVAAAATAKTAKKKEADAE
jgi:hypothetical protein